MNIEEIAEKYQGGLEYDGWRIPDVGTKADHVINDFLFTDYKLYCLYGSVSSGKTVASALAWAAALEKIPKHLELAMIGKTERTLQANVLDPLAEALGRHFSENQGRGIVWIHGRKIRIYGANDVKAEAKIRGKTLWAWYGDEVTTWPESFFMQALARLRRPGARAIMTMNPESPYHWFNVNIMKRAQDPLVRAITYKFTMADNPWLPEDYKAWISHIYAPGTVWHKRYILGDWAAAEGAVFPFFTDLPEDGYVVNELPPDMRYFTVSMDYGQQHPTVMGLFGFSINTKTWYLLKEHYTQNKPNTVYSKEFAEQMLSWDNQDIRPISVDVDPGGGGLSLRVQLRDDYPNLDIRTAIKRDVGLEIQELGSALYTHKLKIYRPCKRVTAEVANYLWDDSAKTRGLDQPLKRDDDGVDMLRYGWQRIKRLSYG